MKLACEHMAQNIFPALRAMIATELQAAGMNQLEAARRMGVSQPAISQYVRQLRGTKTKIFASDAVMQRIKSLSQKVCKGASQEELGKEFCDFCKFLRAEKLVDDVYTASCDI